MAAFVPNGSSQARGWIRATAAGLPHSHSNARSEPHLQLTPHLTAMRDPLIYWAGPDIKPASSQISLGFVSAEPQQELQEHWNYFKHLLWPQEKFTSFITSHFCSLIDSSHQIWPLISQTTNSLSIQYLYIIPERGVPGSQVMYD